MEWVEKFLGIVLSEYGVFVTFLIVLDGYLLFTLKTLWKRITLLEDKLVVIVENNTKVITQLVMKLDEHTQD